MRNALARVPREELKREVIEDRRSVLDSADGHAAIEQLGRIMRRKVGAQTGRVDGRECAAELRRVPLAADASPVGLPTNYSQMASYC